MSSWGDSLKTILAALVFVWGSSLAFAQTWSAGSVSRDVWWVDEDTTVSASTSRKADVTNLDETTATQPAGKASVKVESAAAKETPAPTRKPGEVSDLLTGRKSSVSAKTADKTPKPSTRATVAPRRGDDETPRGGNTRDWVTRSGSVVSVQPATESNNLQVIIETADGSLVEGLVSPHIRVRVPDKGARIRMRGPREGIVEGTETIRVFELERLGPRTPAPNPPPVRRAVRPVPPPPPYGYPVW
ncbi:MAG: hypothetical protein N2111_07060 [Candidatus Sumerlaeaceae bacterium]|nr:hypothetical protein [Candidatus Sumerlaeaceae bacterium]